MKLLRTLALFAAFALIGCKKLPPKEFVGEWEFDAERTKQAILASDLDEEGKMKLSGSYIHMNRGDVFVISKDGYSWFAQASEETRMRLNIQRKEKGTIYVSATDQGVRELGKEYEPTIFKVTVTDNLMEVDDAGLIGFNTFYKRR